MGKKTQNVLAKRIDPNLRLSRPSLPAEWDYAESVEKVKARIYKWSKLTAEVACELWIARAMLAMSKKDAGKAGAKKRWHGANALCHTWENYCQKIGCTKSTVNRWLALWFDDSLVGKLTGNAENYTPKEIIDRVRTVLGKIDLDPASCEMAQETVKASRFYTKEDDGLSKPWRGRVFLNPPYGAKEIKQFTDKLIEELPNMDSAILLTNDQTDTDWWQKCAVHADVICMPDGRIHFYTPDKPEGRTSPTNGQSFFYYGSNINGFRQIFGELGLIVKVLQ